MSNKDRFKTIFVGYLTLKKGQKVVKKIASGLTNKTNNLVTEHFNTYLQTIHQFGV
jgi:hypothetical protein